MTEQGLGPQGQPMPPETPGPGAPIAPDKEQTNWAMLAHLLGLSVYFTALGGIVGPLIVWLVKKDSMPFVDDQGKEAVNFQISMAIYFIAAALLMFVLIGFLLLPVVAVVQIVLTIIGAVNASKGVRYRYPLAIRFIK